MLAGALSNVVFCFVGVFAALYLQQARGMSPFNSGLVFLAVSAGVGSASYLPRRLAEHFPAERLMAIAASVLEILAGSAQAAGFDAAAINVVLRAGAVLAVAGALALLGFGRQRLPGAAVGSAA